MSEHDETTTELTEVTYEVTVRVPDDGPIPSEADIKMAVEHLRNALPEPFKDLVVFSVARL